MNLIPAQLPGHDRDVLPTTFSQLVLGMTEHVDSTVDRNSRMCRQSHHIRPLWTENSCRSRVNLVAWLSRARVTGRGGLLGGRTNSTTHTPRSDTCNPKPARQHQS